MPRFVATLRKKYSYFLFFAFIYLNRFSKFIFRLTYIDGVCFVAWCGLVWRAMAWCLLPSLKIFVLLLSLVAVERHMIFDYNVNASMAAAGREGDCRILSGSLFCLCLAPGGRRKIIRNVWQLRTGAWGWKTVECVAHKNSHTHTDTHTHVARVT